MSKTFRLDLDYCSGLGLDSRKDFLRNFLQRNFSFFSEGRWGLAHLMAVVADLDLSNLWEAVLAVEVVVALVRVLLLLLDELVSPPFCPNMTEI